jgi:hypothetical protein
VQMDKYYISFNTQISPGKIEAIIVGLGVETVSDMDMQMPINLCEHPLYRDLVQYVKYNPPR